MMMVRGFCGEPKPSFSIAIPHLGCEQMYCVHFLSSSGPGRAGILLRCVTLSSPPTLMYDAHCPTANETHSRFVADLQAKMHLSFSTITSKCVGTLTTTPVHHFERLMIPACSRSIIKRSQSAIGRSKTLCLPVSMARPFFPNFSSRELAGRHPGILRCECLFTTALQVLWPD